MTRTSAFLFVTLCFGSASAQQFRIILVDARRGTPVPDECLNVAMGPWHGTDAWVRTNKDGLALISIVDKPTSPDSSVERSCKEAPTETHLQAKGAQATVAVLPNWSVSCQYSKADDKDPTWLAKTPAQRIPAYSMADILTRGVVAANHCTKLAPTAEPGELILIVRKRTFLEGMRS